MKKILVFLSLLLATSVLGCANKAPTGHRHSYEYVEEVAPTCEEPGVRSHYECEGCDKVFVEENNEYVETTQEELSIAPLGHNKHNEAANEPTCEEAGCLAHEHCERCGKLFIGDEEVDEDDILVPALGHQLKTIAAVLPTCTNGGNVEYQECERCHKLYIDGNEVQIEQTAVGALGHELVDVAEVDATCSDDGVMAHKECERCHKLFLDENEVTLDDLEIPASPYKHLIGKDNKCINCNYQVTTVIDNPNIRAWEEYNVPVVNNCVDFAIKNLSSDCGIDTSILHMGISNIRYNQVAYVTMADDTGVVALHEPSDIINVNTTAGAKKINVRLSKLNYQNYYYFHYDLETGSGTPSILFSLGHSGHNLSSFGSCTTPYCEYTTGFKATIGENVAEMNNRVIIKNGVADIVYTGLNDGQNHTYRLVLVTSAPTTSFKLDCGYMKVSDGIITIPQGNANPYDQGDETYTRDISLGDMIHGYFRIKNNGTSAVTITSAKVIVYN